MADPWADLTVQLLLSRHKRAVFVGVFFEGRTPTLVRVYNRGT